MRYLVKRLVMSIPVLIGVSLIIFGIMQVIPGDPVQLMFSGTGATAEQREAMRHALGLDLPLHRQYTNYVLQVVQGDLGQSIHFNQPVLNLILERMPATIELSLFSFVISVGIAFPIGVLSATKRDTIVDHLSRTGATLGISLPTFWIGILLIMFIAGRLGWLPGSGRISYEVGLETRTGFYLIDALLAGNAEALKDAAAHLLLPSIALGIATATFTTRLVRSSVLEVIGQSYVLTARSKGLHEWVVLNRHVLRNALIPIVTLLGVQIGALLGGAVITETIFAWPGIGRLVIQAINARDFPLVQGIVLFFALLRLTVNLITDVLYVWLDPRISHI